MAGKRREFWHPPDYTRTIAYAIQALSQGNANDGQQKIALDWIIRVAAATYDEPFRPGQPDVRDYMLGRRSVGLAIVKLLNLKPEIIPE